MLYERWRQIARERTAEIALREFPTGHRWTFGELAAAADRLPVANEPLACVPGQGPEFILEVLRSWRDQTVLCPLEPGQTPPALPLPPRPIVHLKLTSATTGAARAVAFTGEQLAADAENIVTTMGLRADWPNLGVISLAHSYGFSNLVLPLLLHGIPLVLTASPFPEVLWAAAREMSALTLAAVPALWRVWHTAEVIPPQTRRAISAGAPLSLLLEHEIFASQGVKIHNFYGSTECGGIAYDATESPREDDACAGSPLHRVTLTINPAGCVCVASRAVAESYWPEADAALAQGRFETNDLGTLADGQLFLRGRLGDQINVAGRKVSPASIEQVLATHPAVAACLVLGLPSTAAERSETIAVVVVPRTGVTIGELKNFLLERLPAWQVPRTWRLTTSLGENMRGKLSRAEWRKTLLAGPSDEGR